MKRIGIILMLLHFMILCKSQHIQHSIIDLTDSARAIVYSKNYLEGQGIIDQIKSLYESRDQEIDSLYIEIRLLESIILLRSSQWAQMLDQTSDLDSIYASSQTKEARLQALIWADKSIALMEMDSLSVALEYAQKAYHLTTSRSYPNEDSGLMIMMTLANVYSKLKLYHKSISINLDALQLLDQIDAPFRRRASCYNNLSIAYEALQQYEKAENYLQQALRLHTDTFGDQYSGLQSVYFNLGTVAQAKGDFNRAIEYYQASSKVLAINSFSKTYLAQNHLRIGECKLRIGLLDSADRDFKKAEILYEKLPIEERFQLTDLFNSRGLYFETEGDYRRALTYFEKSYNLKLSIYGNRHPLVAENLMLQALCKTKLVKLGEAKELLTESLTILKYDHQNSDLDLYRHTFLLDKMLKYAGEIYLDIWHAKRDTTDLDTALKYLQDAIAISDQIRSEMRGESSRIVFNDQIGDLYGLIIEVCYQRFIVTGNNQFIQRGLEYAELSRRSTILESILRNQTYKFPEVPAEIIEREKTLKDLLFKEQALLENAQNDQSASAIEIDTIQERLFKKRMSYYACLDTIELRFPDYYHHRYAVRPPDLMALQQSLAPGKMIIEYFDSDKFIYIFGLTRDSLSFKKVELQDTLLSLRDQLLSQFEPSEISDFNPLESVNIYAESAKQLYDVLVAPVLIDPSASDLMIIPDNFESKLPFDALLFEDEGGRDIREWPYLFRRYNLHYTSSILARQEQVNLKRKSAKKMIGSFAPEYEDKHSELQFNIDQQSPATLQRSDGRRRLPGGTKEVAQIRQIFSKKQFNALPATEHAFVEHAGEYMIINICAHAILDQTNPSFSKFLFDHDETSDYDGQLTSAEIGQLDLNAELAVLSACRTGSGISYRGEGVMSLGRAFTYAGVPSTLISFWPVPDLATSILIPEFYKNLKEGQMKHEALNNARQKYLSNTFLDEMCHPYYWAGFVLQGSSNPIEIQHGSLRNLWWLAPVLLWILYGMARVFLPGLGVDNS